ncbi:MAG TPA: DUF898 family protein [Sphingomicrobium sp.]|nr:DUF898 family protein [Sphingomicrobium sp.]
MDALTSTPADNGRAIEFTGTLREYIPIAASNALLTIVTLFVYRSWAKARERRFLWSRTRFIDDNLQWTGTGKEMFVGFLMMALLLGLGGVLFSFGLPALTIRAGTWAGVLAVIGLYLLGMFLYGLARFRGLRYRLSRTWWRGIRGGSNDGGWDYGRKAIGYYLATFLLAGIFYPWAQAKLWNERWRRMSFGPYHFQADMTPEDTKGPFFIMLATAVIGSIVLAAFLGPRDEFGRLGDPPILATVAFYLAVGFAYLNFLTHYYRAAAEWTRIGEIEFRMTADFKDWLKFYAVTVGLAIVTIGLAMFVYEFRKWQFISSHLEVYGTVDVDELTQSQTAVPREAEGILDALDIGAF